jgi:prolipoprotein diacylglyceryltransferase
MHPVLFRIPGVDWPVRTFGALVAGGILFGLWVWGKLLARYGEDPKEDPQRASQAAIWLVVGILVGARLFYVCVEATRYLAADTTPAMREYMKGDARAAEKLSPKELTDAHTVQVGYDFLHDPFQVLLIWQGGLVMYGGMIGGILLGILGARKYGLNPWNALDTALVSGFLGLAIGRWGCLMVGDDYGSLVPEGFVASARPIVLSNGGEIGALTIRVPSADWLLANKDSLFPQDLAGKVLWATQPWMSLNAILIALAGLLWLKLRKHYGVPAALMLLQYAVCRFTIERFRGDPVRGVWFGGQLSTSQIVSLVMFALGLWLLVRRRATPAIAPRA